MTARIVHLLIDREDAARLADGIIPDGLQEQAKRVIEGTAVTMVEAGQAVKSRRGRVLSAVPALHFGSDRKAVNSLRRLDVWLLEEAIREARWVQADAEFKLVAFSHYAPTKLTDPERADLNDYLGLQLVDGEETAEGLASS